MKGKRLSIVAAAFFCILLLPNAAMADNCGGMADCHSTFWAALLAMLAIALFIVLWPLLPAILAALGEALTAIGLVEAVTGRSVFTGEKLAWWERALGIVPFGTFASVTKSIMLAREATALKFYEKLGWSSEKVADHLRGIDFNKPVEIITLPKGTRVGQWQFTSELTGNYFSTLGFSPTQLGIYSNGRELRTYILTEEMTVLRSTANAVKDTLSVPGLGIITEGGGIQFFTLDPSKLLRIYE